MIENGRLAEPLASSAARQRVAAEDPSLDAINGWRGPGALAIAVAHLGIATDYFEMSHVEPIALVVDLFFVLSGILIAKAYTRKLANAAAIPDYVLRRFGRIWPVQAATLAVLVCYELLKLVSHSFNGAAFTTTPFSRDGLNILQAIPTNLLLVHSLGFHDRETWNFPSWSLSVEFATYVVFAAFCLVGPVLRRTLAVATVMMSIAILVVVAPYHMRSTFDYGIFRCLAGFFAGTLCYDVVRRWPQPAWRFPTLVEAGAVGLVGIWLALSVGTQAAFAAPLVFCLFIMAFVPQRGLLSKMLRTRPLQLMAELSFTIYMVHALVLLALLGALHAYERRAGTPLFVTKVNPLAGHPGATDTIRVLHVSDPVTVWVIIAIYVVAVIAVAQVTCVYVERPGRKIFNGLAKRLATAPAPAAAGSPSPQLGSAP